MSGSPTVDAANAFLALVWSEQVPDDQALLAALDCLLAAYHTTPEATPSETELEAPDIDYNRTYKRLAERFSDYGYYPVADPLAPLETTTMMGDAIDDLADLTADMSEMVWLAEHLSIDDAHWHFRLLYFHWGKHARDLAVYLHARQFG